MVLGIDIGGTSIKVGLVNEKGEILEKEQHDTKAFLEKGFLTSMNLLIEDKLRKYPKLSGVGIGFPGLLTYDRKSVILLPNIPAIKDLNVVDPIKKAFPELKVRIENDAKCAAMGEFKFGKIMGLDNFLLITLGTGVGCGVIINKELFIGAHGNGTEVGHVLSDNGQTLEERIGLNPLIKHVKGVIAPSDTMLVGRELAMIDICNAATQGNQTAISVYEYIGKLLGEALVSVIRVMDLNHVLIGGGISSGFDYLSPMVNEVIKTNLPDYYTKNFKLERATLSNDAGILGAAGLVL